MKKIYFILGALLITVVSFGQRIAITGVMDASCSGGTPKAVEIYVEGTIDFATAGYEIVLRANNNPWDNSSGQSLSGLGTVTNGFAYLVNNTGQITQFQTEFPVVAGGVDFTITNLTEINHNGDDSYRIVDSSDDSTVDQFGGDTDGTGTTWEYLDTYAVRNSATGPDSGGFVEANWSFGALNFLDNKGLCNTASTLETDVPFATLTALPVERNDIAGFAMYPNPVVDGAFTIRSMSSAKMNVEIYDLLGKQVYTNSVLASERIDVSNLTHGVYVLKVEDEGKLATRKLVIQ